MFDSKPKLIDYHENLIQAIDLHTETIILSLSKSKDNEIEINTANQTRESFIKEINTIQKFNLDLFSNGCTNQFEFTYCYFIPNLNRTVQSPYDIERYSTYTFKFDNRIGKLLVLKVALSDTIINFLTEQINKKYLNNPMDNFEYQRYQDFAECYVLIELLSNEFKKDSPIIDQTSIESNVIESLQFQTLGNIQPSDFSRYPYLFNVNRVKEFKLVSPKMRQLSRGMFEIFQNLDSLRLDSLIMLRKLDKDCFIGLGNLTKLTIIRSNVSKLQGNVFKQLSNLKELTIKYSNLETISTNAFSGLKNLETLDLSSNQLKAIRNHYFRGLSNLTSLDLKSNETSSVESFAFKCLKQLRQVNVSGNHLEVSVKDLFKFNTNLARLINEFDYSDSDDSDEDSDDECDDEFYDSDDSSRCGCCYGGFYGDYDDTDGSDDSDDSDDS